jgi:hypothetical protein
MVRNHKKKKENSKIIMDKAVLSVLLGNSFRRAAKDFNIKVSTLQYQVWRHKNPPTHTKYEASRVFSDIQEKALVEHLVTAAKIFYGLTYVKTRCLAFEYAVFLKRKMPANWGRDKIAGIDWLQSFMKRHTELSLRKPQNTSLARAIAFNRPNTARCYDNLLLLRSKYHYELDDIINLDESGLTTVMDSPKVIAPRGAHQIGQIVSAERGDLVTYVGIISAAGRVIPPAFVFPRVNFKNHFLADAPIASLGLAHPSGWMTSDNFIKVLEHIKHQKRCSVEQRVLLILDNHESHISIAGLEFCREHGIDVLTLPPHCSHKMQPLDVGLFAPFKNKLKIVMKNHMSMHAGEFNFKNGISKLFYQNFEFLI